MRIIRTEKLLETTGWNEINLSKRRDRKIRGSGHGIFEYLDVNGEVSEVFRFCEDTFPYSNITIKYNHCLLF